MKHDNDNTSDAIPGFFANLFFSRNLHQQFNDEGIKHEGGDDDLDVVRYLNFMDVTNFG